MGLWALNLIWCSTFSILVNVGLRLTLGFLTVPTMKLLATLMMESVPGNEEQACNNNVEDTREA